MMAESERAIQETLVAEGAAAEDVGVYHGCAYILVAEELLDDSDVGARLEEVGGDRVPQRMGRDGLRDPGGDSSATYGPLYDGFVEVVPPNLTSRGVRVDAGGGKDLLPVPFARCRRVLDP
jgi:hypothetical protein